MTCGMVFLGILVSFNYMLSEYKFSTAIISMISWATCPYGCRFIVSPIIKNLIYRYKGTNLIKIGIFTIQLIIAVGISLLGFYQKGSSSAIIFINIFIIVLVSSVYDLIVDCVRLQLFQDKTLGIATSIGTIGFRIGMLWSSVGILYLASFVGWKYSFLIASLITAISTVATIILPKNTLTTDIEKEEIQSPKTYFRYYFEILKKYNVVALLLLIFSLRFGDSCINGLKVVFLQTKGLSKVEFANISQLIGMTVLIIAGIIAGFATYKYDIRKCIKASLFFNIVPALCFIHMSHKNNSSILDIAFMVNLSTFCFGFSSVVYRTFVSKLSESNINVYTILLSIGSILRLASMYFGGIIVDQWSWSILFTACFMVVIPGLFIIFSKKIGPKFHDNYT
jgi:predicted MFS family arabinose efflux permease